MTIKELVDQEVERFISKGDCFDLPKLFEAVDRRRSEIEDDSLATAIWAAIRSRDKSARSNRDGQLAFGAHFFPEVLVVGKTERQPSKLGLLRDVLTDQTVKEANAIQVAQAIQEVRVRNLELLPYLERGLTVEQAIAAWEIAS